MSAVFDWNKIMNSENKTNTWGISDNSFTFGSDKTKINNVSSGWGSLNNNVSSGWGSLNNSFTFGSDKNNISTSWGANNNLISKDESKKQNVNETHDKQESEYNSSKDEAKKEKENENHDNEETQYNYKKLDFQNKCIKIYKDTIEKSLDEINTNFENELKNSISKINNENLYDYKELEDIVITLENETFNLSKNDDIKKFIKYSLEYTNNNNSDIFKNLEKDEKIVIYHQNRGIKNFTSDSPSCNNEQIMGDFVNHLTFITNYSRILILQLDHNFIGKTDRFFNCSQVKIYHEFKFWIPIDYIKLIKNIVINGDRYMKNEVFNPMFSEPYLGTVIDPRLLYNMLSFIKEKLYNRIYIPYNFIQDYQNLEYEYNKEVAENKDLKDKIKKLNDRLSKIYENY